MEITITQESNMPDKSQARVAAAKTVAAGATTGIGTKLNGVHTEAPSAEHPHGVSYISVLVDPDAVTAAAS